MSVEQRGVVDAVGIDEKTDEVIMLISDHLMWNDPKSDHLFVLQEKINEYLGFIEEGELFKKYPRAKGKKIIIQVVGEYPLSDIAKEFYERAGGIVEKTGSELRFKLLSEIENEK